MTTRATREVTEPSATLLAAPPVVIAGVRTDCARIAGLCVYACEESPGMDTM
jgi:hypothetical protein